LAAALAAAGLALAVAPAALAQEGAAPQIDSAALEKAWNEAVTAARASLPVFWERMAENPGVPDDYSLKVVFRNPQGGIEDIWLSDIKRQDGHIFGRLNYDPDTLPNMHRMQIVPISEADIIDWTFKEGRKRYGHFTTRVQAKAHPEDAAKTMALLSDNPLPADARSK
jgi:uncharacterized protein YegJ (DUF2314 family)